MKTYRFAAVVAGFFILLLVQSLSAQTFIF